MKRIISLSIFLCFLEPAFSQPKFSKPGYVITLANDTLPGNIRLIDSPGYMMMVVYWDPLTKKKKDYRADKIKGFVFDDRYYESLVWKGAHYYFEQLIKGYPVSLYVTPYRSPGAPAVGTGLMVSGIKYDECFLTDNSGMTLLKQLGFRKFMINYAKDCPALIDKLEKKELEFHDLKQIVEEYNACSKK